jgi:hypothetical protein
VKPGDDYPDTIAVSKHSIRGYSLIMRLPVFLQSAKFSGFGRDENVSKREDLVVYQKLSRLRIEIAKPAHRWLAYQNGKDYGSPLVIS